jgi:SNW domain-containing protein 1
LLHSCALSSSYIYSKLFVTPFYPSPLQDHYNLYDKPLFAQRTENFFRPVKGADDELYGEAGEAGKEGVNTKRFKPDRGFAGADEAGPRGGAVEFETGDDDPFGLGAFLGADGGKKKNALDAIGKGGGMRAGGGGGGSYEDYAQGSGRSRVDFERGSGKS